MGAASRLPEARQARKWPIVRGVFGLFVGAIHLFVLVNACVRSIVGKWVLGSIGALLRTFLLLALTMANTRIRVAGAEPTLAFFIALFGGPLLSLIMLLLAFRRRRAMPAGSEAQSTAGKIISGWIAVTVFDAMFVAVNVAAHLMSKPH
jgi:hypothetical protein